VITADAARALKLKRGNDAIAIIKSTEVMIATAGEPPRATHRGVAAAAPFVVRRDDDERSNDERRDAPMARATLAAAIASRSSFVRFFTTGIISSVHTPLRAPCCMSNNWRTT
jgi:hypothetical protein